MAPRTRASSAGFSLLLAATLAGATVSAQPRKPADRDVKRRLAAVNAALASEAPKAELWNTAWTLTYLGFAVGQGAFAVFTDDRGLRVDSAVGASKSALGFLALLIQPLPARSSHAELSALPEHTPEERRLKLRVGERLLRDSAAAERQGQGILPRIAGNVVNLAGTYVLWLGYERYASGWLGLIGGMAVGELQIRTQPTRNIADWDHYREQFSVSGAAGTPPLSVFAFERGLGVRGSF